MALSFWRVGKKEKEKEKMMIFIVNKSVPNKSKKEQGWGSPAYSDAHGDVCVALHVPAHAETQLCSAHFLKILVLFFVDSFSATNNKNHTSYLYCCGCALIRHPVEQSLRACGSEPNGGREPFDLLKRRGKYFKKGWGNGGRISSIFLTRAFSCLLRSWCSV